MNKSYRIFFIILLILFSWQFVIFAEEIKKEDVLEIIKQKTESIEDISFDLDQSNALLNRTTSMKGTLKFKSPDKFKADIQISDNFGGDLKSLSVYDGDTLYQQQQNKNDKAVKVFKSTMKSSSPQAEHFMKQFNPKTQVLRLLADYNLLTVEEEKGLYVLNMEIKPQVRSRMSQMMKAFLTDGTSKGLIPDMVIMRWDKKNNYIDELIMYSKNQDLKFVTKYNKVKINQNISSNAFNYKVPEGSQVIDLTDIMAQEVLKKELPGKEHELVGSKFPDFSLPNLIDDTVSFDSFKNEVLIVVFWEQWCSSCMKELPEIESLYQTTYTTDAKIITVTTDKQQAEMVVQENNYSFPVLIDQATSLATKLNIQSIPRIFVVDKEGIIVAVYIGYKDNIKQILTDHIIELNKDEE